MLRTFVGSSRKTVQSIGYFRGITFGVDFKEMDRRDMKVNQNPNFRSFMGELEKANVEPAPGWRYEYLKPNEKRSMKANKLAGRKSVNKVKGIIDLINLKRDIRMD